MKIGASTPYDFTGRNLAYGGLLPVATMLQAIGLGAVNFQILRRTWITELSKAESDPKVRAQIAGQSVDVHENERRQPGAAAAQRAPQGAMDKLDERLHKEQELFWRKARVSALVECQAFQGKVASDGLKIVPDGVEHHPAGKFRARLAERGRIVAPAA